MWQIYLNIQIFEYIGQEYLFGHSFVFIILIQIYPDIRSYQICLYEYIRTFIRECIIVWKQFKYPNIGTIFHTNMYSDIQSCHIFITNIFKHLFVSFFWYEYIGTLVQLIFLWISHSASYLVLFVLWMAMLVKEMRIEACIKVILSISIDLLQDNSITWNERIQKVNLKW